MKFLFFVCVCSLILLCTCHGERQSCIYPPHERSLNAIVHSLFRDSLVPPGEILDVGAHNGSWSCMYACFAPDRIVHAVDPSPLLVDQMSCERKNFRKHLYALSNRTGTITFHEKEAGDYVGVLNYTSSKSGNVPVSTLDILFTKWNTRPAFLHIDVEGYELEVLQGGATIIKKYKPIFTIEAHVERSISTYIHALIKFAVDMNYSVFMVNEICGMRESCRNFLCLPNGPRSMRTSIVSPTLDIAWRSRHLVRVFPNTVLDAVDTYRSQALAWNDNSFFVHPQK